MWCGWHRLLWLPCILSALLPLQLLVHATAGAQSFGRTFIPMAVNGNVLQTTDYPVNSEHWRRTQPSAGPATPAAIFNPYPGPTSPVNINGSKPASSPTAAKPGVSATPKANLPQASPTAKPKTSPTAQPVMAILTPTPGTPNQAVLWRPTPGTTWQWQLSGKLDLTVDAQVFDVDLFDTSKEDVAALHAMGKHVICYISAGTYENWRPDATSFPAAVLGDPLDDWPGERWLDIRKISLLQPIIEQRLDLCRTKGFDGVEFDNVDAYQNDTGLSLGAADQLAYNRLLARLAKERGLSPGLKNAVELAARLEPDFEWAINEECVKHRECEELTPFTAAGKAVFHVEYRLSTSQFCSKTAALGFSSIRKKPSLNAWREACP